MSSERIEFKLSHPIEAHNETTTVLRLRVPNAGDLAECGMPFKVGDGHVDFNPRVVIELASRLAGVPPSTIKALSLPEYTELQRVIFRFFSSETEAAEVEAAQTVMSPDPSSSIPRDGSQPALTLHGSGEEARENSSTSPGTSSPSMPNRRRA